MDEESCSLLGGRGGFLWFLYPPPLSEIIKNEVRKLNTVERRLARSMAQHEKEIKQLKTTIVKAADKNDKDAAVNGARNLKATRVKYAREHTQRQQVVDLKGKLTTEDVGVSLDRGLMLMCSIATKRSAVVNPARFTKMMLAYDRAKIQNETKDEMMSQMHEDDNDDMMQDAGTDAADNDSGIQDIFRELGVYREEGETFTKGDMASNELATHTTPATQKNVARVSQKSEDNELMERMSVLAGTNVPSTPLNKY